MCSSFLDGDAWDAITVISSSSAIRVASDVLSPVNYVTSSACVQAIIEAYHTMVICNPRSFNACIVALASGLAVSWLALVSWLLSEIACLLRTYLKSHSRCDISVNDDKNVGSALIPDALTQWIHFNISAFLDQFEISN